MTAPPITEPLVDRLEEHLASSVDGRPWGGLAFGVVDARNPDGILRFAGRLGPGGGPPEPSTLFDLASISKTFTALLLEIQLQRRPEWIDACCGDFLPAGAPPMDEALARVPWRSIPGFISGLPSDNLPTGPTPDYRRFNVEDGGKTDSRQVYSAERLFEHAADPGFAAGGFPVRPPAEAYTYSSLGFALLAETLATAVGEGRFADLLTSSLLGPLGMHGTRLLDDAARRLLPACFDRRGEPAEPGFGGGFPAHFGSAGVVTTPADLMTWLRFQMGYLPGHPFSALLPNVQQPVTELRTPAGLRAGRGWFLKEMETARGPRQVVLKSGGIGSFVAWMSFVAVPRPGLLPSPVGLFALSNADFDIRAFGMEALKILVEEGGLRRRRSNRPTSRSRGSSPRVSYGLPALASSGGHAAGGIVKFQPLQREFPNQADDFDVLCLVSSRLPPGAVEMARAAQARGARLIYNQAGAATPATHDTRWRKLNEPLKTLLHMADHVVYQSEFACRVADRFLGSRRGPWELLYNAVDTEHFRPAETDPNPEREIVLLGGTQYRWYRLETGLRAFAALLRHRPGARLLISGQLVWIPDQAAARRRADDLVHELGIEEAVEFLGSYTQETAPDVFRRAHVLLHPMFLDCCPTVVLEAMACGLPVVYGDGGGVPELVGAEAGIAVSARGDVELHHPPDPDELAGALDQALDPGRRLALGTAGRRRAVERFDLKPWVRRYRELILHGSRPMGRR